MHVNFETNREAQAPAPVDLTGAGGTVFRWVCPFEKATIYSVGIVSLEDTGVVTTPPVLEVMHRRLDTTSSLVGPGAILSLEPGMIALSAEKVSLDGGYDADTVTVGAVDFPHLLFGEVLEFELTTPGVGGVQSVIPFLVFSEKHPMTT